SQRVGLAFGQLDLAAEPQPQLPDLRLTVVAFQHGGDHDAAGGGGVLGAAVERDRFCGTADEAGGRVVERLDEDLDLVGGEEFGGSPDGGVEDADEVDVVQLVGGTGEALPGLPFLAATDPARGEQVERVQQRRHGEQ